MASAPSDGASGKASDEVYDLLILVDATYSMSDYLQSLQTSLPKVIALSKLTNSFERIGLLAYRDYTESGRDKDGMLEWSGWYQHGQDANSTTNTCSADQLLHLAASLEPIGGGDYPEATKTGLAKAYSFMREDATTIVLLYTDAPPHCWMVADKDRGSNYHLEQAALSKKNSYDGCGPAFVDWVSACKTLHQGPKKAHVFCFLDEGLEGRVVDAGFYIYMSTVTRGACFYMTDRKPHSISQVTVDVLLAWMGAEKAGSEVVELPAKLVRYANGQGIKQIKDEKDANANIYFYAQGKEHRGSYLMQNAEQEKAKKLLRGNLASVGVNGDALKKHLPKKRTLVTNFSERYAKDEVYKSVVVEELRNIIGMDVTSMALNPVFGSLWRTVCNDRSNPAREELITAFGLNVDKIANADEKTRMKNWLEESYDYAAEILADLDSVPQEESFPCVYLDPTLEFGQALQKGEKIDEDEEQNRPVTAFRRDELLEIGRSCDGRILRRLGKVLTRISYAASVDELPAHVANTTNAAVPKIPVALASKKHGWKFWKILLHIVLPGTMLAARPAVVLAALAIRIGLKPFFEPACAAMRFWRDKWNNLEVPETWNSSCLDLLLDADAEYRKQMGLSNAVGENDGGVEEKDNGLLLDVDRQLFSRLVAYKLAEANLLTTLTAEVGWTPAKSQMPVGAVVTCRGCQYPRSVTIMAEKSGGKCGLCVATDWNDAEHKQRGLAAQVSKEDTDASNAVWTECSVRTCRAQYVLYNPSDLNVRAKCHYCRLQGALPDNKRSDNPAPTLECEKCLNKVIWPREWRSLAPSPFNCTSCLNNRMSIVPVETNAEKLCKENGQAWLLQNGNNVLKEPFKRTLFHTISTVGAEDFLANVRILPNLEPEPTLTVRGKRIHNHKALKEQLQTWITRRATERSPCSLCFSYFHNSRLLPACRRRGCNQSICTDCLNGWYGLNSAGSIINTAALFCPFCQRPPAARTLAAYGKGVHAVGDVAKAVSERGQWVHAWCYDCGKARRLMERECARGAPDAVTEWKCEDCQDMAIERARIAEEEARLAMEAAARLEARDRVEAERQLRLAEKRRRELEVPVKECPGCKTPTQKAYGCDHMTCTVRGCGMHWCWACAKGFGNGRGRGAGGQDVYEHMRREHGGFYAGGTGVEDDDDGTGYDSDDGDW